MTRNEILAVVRTVRQNPCGNFLVFGLGNDSLFWQSLNHSGLTGFIEDDVAWLEMVRARDGLRLVSSTIYNTQLKDWRDYLIGKGALELALLDEITKQKWDVILVDGPAAWCPTVPGRMKSIAISTYLVRPNGVVFVHDYNRDPEFELSNHFLGEKTLVGRVDNLAHFQPKKS